MSTCWHGADIAPVTLRGRDIFVASGVVLASA
jgi:hypothetical protein